MNDYISMREMILVFSTLCSLISFGQNTDLLDKLKTSDSIVVINHKTLDKYRSVTCDSLGNYIEGYSLLRDGNINPEVVVKKVLLNSEQTKVIVSYLSAEVEGSEVGYCFDPHHSILMYQNGELSYLDICFICSNFEYSVDSIDLTFSSFHWTNLTSFMNSLGLIRKDLNYDGDSIPTHDCREFLSK